jgi:hypothetical protein
MWHLRHRARKRAKKKAVLRGFAGNRVDFGKKYAIINM